MSLGKESVKMAVQPGSARTLDRLSGDTQASDPAVPHASEPAEAIRFSGVTQRFTPPNAPAFNALTDITFSVGASEFWSIVGPSGCGKSTLLNMAAGLIHPSSGAVAVLGEDVTSVNTKVGYVTQDSNLLPWLTTYRNIELPLEIRGFGKAERRDLTKEWIDLVGLRGFENSYPHQLSGGMQKRCSIARTLVYDPDVLLLDEPFGAVDAITRSTLQDTLLNLWSDRRKSVIFVTHDLNEAIALSDKVVVMTKRPGTIKAIVDVELLRPRDVYQITESPEFAGMHQQLWELFKSEI
jgi:sulfonate transport system ATP-binding protein